MHCCTILDIEHINNPKIRTLFFYHENYKSLSLYRESRSTVGICKCGFGKGVQATE
jgi:hypothetical protein